LIARELKVVTVLPLPELWSSTTEIGSAQCLGIVDGEQVTELLRQGPVRFVVADLGHRPSWIGLSDRWTFWKNEVKPHLAKSADEIVLEEYPDRYAYVAKRWSTRFSETVIVLEKHH
jgi:hypothetical protein